MSLQNLILDSYREHLETLAQVPKKLWVMCSGGIDSTVLIVELCRMVSKGEINAEISVVHLNYKLRGEDSQNDALFVKNLCKSLNVPFFLSECDLSNLARGENLQERARDERYAFANLLAGESGIVVTAHHLQDRLETTMFRMLRGMPPTSWDNLKAFSHSTWRPLLSANRTHIESYAARQGVTYRQDRSNDSLKYDRNKVRLFLNDINENSTLDFKGWQESMAMYANMHLELVSAMMTTMKGSRDGSLRLKETWNDLTTPFKKSLIAEFLKNQDCYNFRIGKLVGWIDQYFEPSRAKESLGGFSKDGYQISMEDGELAVIGHPGQNVRSKVNARFARTMKRIHSNGFDSAIMSQGLKKCFTPWKEL